MEAHQDPAFVKELFFQQMKRLSVHPARSFELQFSDNWVRA